MSEGDGDRADGVSGGEPGATADAAVPRRTAEGAADELTGPVKPPAKRARGAAAKRTPAASGPATAASPRAPRKRTAAASAAASPGVSADTGPAPDEQPSGSLPARRDEPPGDLAPPARGDVARHEQAVDRPATGGTPPPADGPAAPSGAGRGRLGPRVAVVLLLVVLGALAGVVAAGRATPSWTADAQVLVRERDYAAIILGQSAVAASNTPQRSLAAQVLAAQSPTFTDEVARQADVEPAVVREGLVVTASPDANVVVFTMTAPDPTQAVAVPDIAADLLVSTYRDQLVQGLGSIAAGGSLDATQLDQLAQVQAFERISPSAQVIADAGEATGGETSGARGALTGGAAGAVVGFLLLGADAAWRSRGAGSRRRP